MIILKYKYSPIFTLQERKLYTFIEAVCQSLHLVNIFCVCKRSLSLSLDRRESIFMCQYIMDTAKMKSPAKEHNRSMSISE